MGKKLRVHKIESFSTLDGPGVRMVIFLQGCLMQCGYCHNADTWNLEGGYEVSIETLYHQIMRFKVYFGECGGVTFSGGEPLLQSQELTTLCQMLKEASIHVAIETSGYPFAETEIKLFQSVDLVILDVKSFFVDDSDVSNEKQHECLLYLKEQTIPYWIRQVILKNINDKDMQIRALLNQTYAKSREKVELLPYHTLGEEKWTCENEQYHINYQPPDSATMLRLIEMIENYQNE